MRQKQLQRILIVFLALSFFSSTALALVGMFANQDVKTARDPARNAEARSEQERLQAQIRGYESVLQREPENQAALAGIVQLRLKIGDLPGAIAPLEKLVALNPQEPSYKALLAQIKNLTAKPETNNQPSGR